MKTPLPILRKRSRGSVAVEFAILVATVLPVLLTGVLFYGRYMWHYTVAEKAAHDAARFMAAAFTTEFKTAGPGGAVAIVAAARALALRELAELHPGEFAPEVAINCDRTNCFVSRPVPPQTVTVEVYILMEDPFLGGLFAVFNGGVPPAIPIDVIATSYVGN